METFDRQAATSKQGQAMTDTLTPLTDALIKERSRYVVFDDPEPMSMEDHARTIERDLTACRAALRELVALKDLHDRIDALDWSLYTFADAERANELQAEYGRRKPLAWSAARAILQSTGEGEGK